MSTPARCMWRQRWNQTCRRVCLISRQLINKWRIAWSLISFLRCWCRTNSKVPNIQFISSQQAVSRCHQESLWGRSQGSEIRVSWCFAWLNIDNCVGTGSCYHPLQVSATSCRLNANSDFIYDNIIRPLILYWSAWGTNQHESVCCSITTNTSKHVHAAWQVAAETPAEQKLKA